jgi:outer membrane protein
MAMLRRHAVAFVVCTVLGAVSTARAQEAASVLTLAQAVNEALARNDRLVTQQDFTEAADLGVRAANSVFRPKIIPNIRGSFGQTNVANQNYGLTVSQRFVSGTEMSVGFGASTQQIPSLTGGADVRFYNTDSTIMVTQPLLRGFGPAVARRSLTSAEQRQSSTRLQQTVSEQQVTLEVVSAYYRVVAQEALVKVARQSFDRSRQLRDASEAKLEAGLVSQLDALRAQQLVAQAELQLFDAQSAVEDAQDQLRFLIGRGERDSLVVVGEIPTVGPEALSEEEAVSLAMTRRLDLQIAVADAADADRTIAFARNQLLPQVDVNFALTRRQTSDSLLRSVGLEGFQFATFFNVSMPVDRTPQIVEYQTSLIDRDRRRREIETLRRRIADDVRRQVRNQGRVQRNLLAAETSVKIAESEVEVAKLRYERGLSNNLDVVTAEANLLTTESRRITTLAELVVSRLNLRAATGILDPRRDPAEVASGAVEP